MGRCFGAALFVCALGADPARAATHSLPVLPLTSRGGEVRAEDPVLRASVRLPAGNADAIDQLGLAWSPPPSRGSAGCRPRVIISAYASPKPVRMPARTRRGPAATVIVTTPAGARRVRGATYALPGGDFGFDRVVRVRLPADVLPAYPRRSIILSAVSFRLGGCARAQRRAAQVAAGALRGASLVTSASYTPPPPLDPPRAVDLAATPGLLMQGVRARDEAGRELAAAGDVNGDGLADAVVSSPYGGPGRRGTATVVFGRPGGGTVDLGKPGPGGFVITGPARGTFALPAAGIGDLDGDGLGDLVVGAPAAHGGAGAAYVVRGSASSEPVDLARPGRRLLFEIRGGRPCRGFPGAGAGDNLGAFVAAAGDADGDGLPDVAVLSPHNCADPDGGGIYVVFGSHSSRAVDVTRLGPRGIAVPAEYEAQFANAVIAGAGDTNGDGLADLIVGRGDSSPGVPAAEIVPGRRTGATLRLARLRFQLRGHACGDVGQAAAAAGDVNGDGLADVVVAGGSDTCGPGLGLAYVVFGTRTPAPVDLLHLGDRGLTIRGLPGSAFAAGATGVGDVNGDGLADVAVADSDATVFGRRLGGEVFLVHGRREPGTVDLRWAGAGAPAWAAARPQAGLGTSLAGIGDFDGDGRPDLLAGAPGPEAAPGAAYVLPMP